MPADGWSLDLGQSRLSPYAIRLAGRPSEVSIIIMTANLWATPKAHNSFTRT